MAKTYKFGNRFQRTQRVQHFVTGNMFGKNWWHEKSYKATREATYQLFKLYLFLGLLKPKKCKVPYYLYSAIMNTTVCFSAPIFFFLSYFFERNKMNTSQLLTSLQVAINVCGLPAKFTTIYSSMKQRQGHAMALMDTLDGRCQRKDEHELIRGCAQFGNRLTLFYLVFYALYSSSTFVTSVISGQPPYSLFMPIMDWRNSTTEFVTQSLIEYTLMNFIILHQAGYDVYAVIYVYIVRTHMNILVKRVKRLGRDKDTSNDDHYEQLIQCIRDHQNLLSLLDTISPLLSVTMFTQLMATAFILGTTLINILIFADTNAQIASVIYFIGVLVQSTPCCYQATCLMSDGEQLPLAIFHCEWSNKDKRFRQMMIFFMMRAQRPVMFSAMKLFPINLSTSLGIAKFSFSLYTLIEQMDFGQTLKN